MPSKPLAAARCSGRSPTSPLAFTSAPNFSSSFATWKGKEKKKINLNSDEQSVKMVQGLVNLPAHFRYKKQYAVGWKTQHPEHSHKLHAAGEYLLPGGGEKMSCYKCAKAMKSPYLTSFQQQISPHLMVPSQCGYVKGSEGTVAHLLHIWPSMEKCSQVLSIILWYRNTNIQRPLGETITAVLLSYTHLNFI